MNKIWLMPVLICTLAAAAYSQDIGNPQILRELGLTDEEMLRVIEIRENTQKVQREAQIELNLYKAQLEKLLFPAEVDMKEVERLLKASLEWKLKLEFAEVRKRVEIRKILGEDRWEKLLHLLANRRKSASMHQRPPEHEKRVNP